MSIPLVILIVLVIFIVSFAVRGIKIVQQAETMVVPISSP